MSMEGGFDLDSPDDDWMSNMFAAAHKNEDLPENARPVVVPRIEEPDAASIDEIPTPMVTLDQVLEQARSQDLERAGDINYWYLVESENNKHWKKWYDGHVIADAMAAYTAAILDGDEYVMLESLRTPDNGPD